jgi:hypothetical protein
MCSVNPALASGRAVRPVRGLLGSVAGDVMRGGSPAVNPIKRTIENASPSVAQGFAVQPSSYPASVAQGAAALSMGNANPFTQVQFKMNSSNNKNGRVVS